jgi:nucleotide-binding universal stress UspA family protein
METILIATDFSSAARNATEYGFELARVLRAKVILFTAYQHSMAATDSPLYISAEEQQRDSYQRLFKEAASIDPRRTVALETFCVEGPVDSSILSAASKKNVSYIVVGMKERGKEIRKYIGSTVTGLSKMSGIPLIVVPADAPFSIPKTIALASDINDETDIHILEPLKKMSEFFQSNLYVVRVIKKSMNESVERVMRSERLAWFLNTIQHSFEFIKADNVAKALNSFVVQQSVNMVAVIPHEHTLFERLFTRSVTKDLVFHSHVPLLIIPGKKDNKHLETENELVSSEFFYGVC